MIVYPAMDLIGGRPVRLRQGRFEDSTFYNEAPAAALARFAAAGATWAHIVDLDGTRVGEPVQHDLLSTLARSSGLKLQVAGGIRTAGHVARLFEQGVDRAVVGSLCVTRPDLVGSMLDSFGPDRITLAMDVRVEQGTPRVAMHGWQAASGLSLWELAGRFPQARHLLLTDIGRDGMLEGPNAALYGEAAERLPHLAIQASGGISSLADIAHLPTDGAIVGKALWEGHIPLSELFT
ncbi:HisA/HisF-related TIM barrel protein [Sphingomonas sp. BN140010]|uniref:1-(5-phosphoribosyl)-5-[(5-phosphoribosylamino)methylideneamino] imidazole-4-carboxamide isomerase n=1 Tax=Sphingomonas arvum TaxID=2992113 RepID=A0ABT3JBH4_9SPHN|nr:HisA/HisF-related TIM barrel protein [Sphingomonas sp. BN140010]MCW3796423.1 HisA/HisF-related TIM barrel protein [Sphingomonas sp. BN140010]